MRFDAMLRHVLPSVRGCPEDVAEDALRQAAAYFCDETGIWVEQLPEVLTTAGVNLYALATPSDAVVARLRAVSVDGEDVDHITTATEARAMLRAGETDSFAWMVGQRDLGISPTPGEDQSLIAECVLKPAPAALELPDEYADQYRDEIVYGALARLLRMPSVGWRDPRAAEEQETLFRQRITEVAGLAGLGHVQGPLRVRNL